MDPHDRNLGVSAGAVAAVFMAAGATFAFLLPR
jgi:hypothetical protein